MKNPFKEKLKERWVTVHMNEIIDLLTEQLAAEGYVVLANEPVMQRDRFGDPTGAATGIQFKVRRDAKS